jgi:hypothetical protein
VPAIVRNNSTIFVAGKGHDSFIGVAGLASFENGYDIMAVSDEQIAKLSIDVFIKV